MICEKCWSDAYIMSLETFKSQYECYQELLIERKETPCALKEQIGERNLSEEEKNFLNQPPSGTNH